MREKERDRREREIERERERERERGVEEKCVTHPVVWNFYSFFK